jgi:hypothetical protein
MASVHLVLMILAVLCELFAAIGVSYSRGNLVAAGLFFWALAVTVR